MKIGFTTFACPDWSIARIVEAAVKHKYNGVEVRCDATQSHGAEVWTDQDQRREIRTLFDSADVQVCCLGTGLQFSSNKVLDDVQRRIQLAMDLGAPAMRVFCGPMPHGVPVDLTVKKVAEQLHSAAQLAEQARIEIWLETHDSMSRAETAAAAVRMARHKSVGITYDNLHPFRMGESVEDTFTHLDGLIRHCHFHDGLKREDAVVVKPFGQGDMPLDEMFERLVKSDYQGYLCGEWFYDQYGEDPDDALSAYHAEIMTLADRRGIKIG